MATDGVRDADLAVSQALDHRIRRLLQPSCASLPHPIAKCISGGSINAPIVDFRIDGLDHDAVVALGTSDRHIAVNDVFQDLRRIAL